MSKKEYEAPKYTLEEWQALAQKQMRGKPNHSTDPIDLSYWVDRNFNDTEDTSIQKTANLSAPTLSKYKGDKTLLELHEQSISWRQNKIANFLTESDSFYLYARAIQAGSTKVLSQSHQKRLFGQLMQMRRNMSRKNLKA